MSRPTPQQQFIKHARLASERATCLRAKHGAVIVKRGHVVATGYNGSISGTPHCTDAGCDMLAGHCVRCNHAEMNALTQAAKLGFGVEGADIYVTGTPCWPCFRMLVSAGIDKVYFGEAYGTPGDRQRIEDTEAFVGERLQRIEV